MKLVYGVGFNDLQGQCESNGKKLKFYTAWRNMLKRCYCAKYHIQKPTYVGCLVCDEWLILSKFKKWYDLHYVDGFHLDKDLLVEGNKLYSPDTCVFVSQRLNQLMCTQVSGMGEYPTGVSLHAKTGKFKASIRKLNKRVYLGLFDTPDEASVVYQNEKRLYIDVVCEEQRGIDSDLILNKIREGNK